MNRHPRPCKNRNPRIVLISCTGGLIKCVLRYGSNISRSTKSGPRGSFKICHHAAHNHNFNSVEDTSHDAKRGSSICPLALSPISFSATPTPC